MILGAIDIGSNAARLYICSIHLENGFPKHKVIEFIRVPLRLGDYVFINKTIPEKKATDLLDMMKSFALLLKLFRTEKFRACATSALREAENGPELVNQIEAETGIKIEIISGQEEADLIWRAQLNLLDMHQNSLFVDVGGGSTEISLLSGKEKIASRSFNLGTVRILDNQDDEIVWKELSSWLKSTIKPRIPNLILGSGGNINKAFDLLKIKNGKSATYKNLKELYNYLQRYSLKERVQVLGLNPDRADVIIPALEIYLYVMEATEIKKIAVTGMGLKEGIVFDLFYQLTQTRPAGFDSSARFSII